MIRTRAAPARTIEGEPVPNAPPSSRSGGKRRRRVGAVVIGGDYQGLGIVRSLGRQGVPVCVIDDEPSISRFSRYTTHTVRVESLRDQDQSIDVILEVGRRLHLDGWVLYPTREETVAALSRHRERLLEQFLVPTPGFEVIKWAWDKRETYELARQLDIPTPRTWYPSGTADLKAIDAQPPFAIKPAIKENFIYATRAKAWMARSAAEAEELFTRAGSLVGPGEVMVQEFIPGGGSQQFAYCAFFKAGQAIGSMVVRRLRQHPLDFGRASTLVETTDEPLLVAQSERLLRAIDYYGLAELEYKLDPRDGRYKLLDFNARTWGYHSLGRAAGVDFPQLLYRDQLGDPPDPCRARAGVRWVRLLTDVPTAIAALRRGQLDWKSYARSLVRPRPAEAVFCRDDPLPGLIEVGFLPYLALKRGF
jgi:predicted ATP-grasp superfamily ATP-dependent carboligase